MFSQLWKKITGATADPTSTDVTIQPDAIASPSAAAEPAATVRPENNPRVATELTLRRSLDWRSKVLMDNASAQAKQGDGPTLVDALRKADDSIIR